MLKGIAMAFVEEGGSNWLLFLSGYSSSYHIFPGIEFDYSGYYAKQVLSPDTSVPSLIALIQILLSDDTFPHA